MTKIQMMVAVGDLIHAPWNPRNEAELDAGHPEMVKLIASVRELGVIQPIAVWGDPDPKMVIAGNRRFASAIAVGIQDVPAFVFTDISEAQAREITRVENEVRIGIDPLKDAELIGSMISLGYEQKEIAAHFGVSEAMICRRVKLMGLLPEIRVIAQRSGNFATQCLEQIALYPIEIQRECLADVTRNSKRQNATVHWSDLQWSFSRETMDLNGAKFNTSACMKCPKRTGSQPDLFGDLNGDDDLGRCLDGKCFDCKMRKRNEAIVRDRVGENVDIVCADDDEHRICIMNLPDWCADLFGDSPTKKRQVAWWSWETWSDKFNVKFGPTVEEWKKLDDDRRAAVAAEKADRENESEEAKAKREAEEAERKRIREERAVLDRAVDVAGGLIEDIICEAINDKKFVKAVKTGVCGKAFKGKAADLVSEAVAEWVGSYDCENSFKVSLLEAFPALAKSIKVKADLLKKFREAEKALAAFDAAHTV